jgi:hypothetical protein
VDGRYCTSGAAFGHHIARAGLALTALRCNTQFKLNLIEAHASVCVAGDFAVRDAVAYTNDHGRNSVAGYGFERLKYK